MDKDKALEILGLTKNATPLDIRKKYRELALKYHPDKNKDHDVTEKFIEIAGAYEILLDNKSKNNNDVQSNASNKNNDSGDDVQSNTSNKNNDSGNDLQSNTSNQIENADEIRDYQELANSIKEYKNLLSEAENDMNKELFNDAKYEDPTLISSSVSKDDIAYDNYSGDVSYIDGYYYPHGFGVLNNYKSDKFEGKFRKAPGINTFTSIKVGIGKLTKTDNNNTTTVYLGFWKKDGYTMGMCKSIYGDKVTYYEDYQDYNENKKHYKNITDKISDDKFVYFYIKQKSKKEDETKTKKLLKALGICIERDVEKYVKKAQEQSKTALQNEEDKKNNAKTNYGNAIDEANIKPTSELGYIIEENTTTEKDGYYGSKYYGNVKENSDGEIVAHGLGVLTVKTRPYHEYYTEFVGTFVDGKFTGLGYKRTDFKINNNNEKEKGTGYFGFFKDGKLNGMGMTVNKYSDKFNDDKPHESYPFLGYYFPDYRLYASRKDGGNGMYGVDYYLIKIIKENIVKDVNDFAKKARDTATAAEKKQENDKEKEKINNEKNEESFAKAAKQTQQIKQEEDKKKEEKNAKTNAEVLYEKAIKDSKPGEIKDYGTLIINGNNYEGGTTNSNSPFGVGTLTMINGDVYQGNFNFFKIEGLGQLTYKESNNIYKGFFENGKPTGMGVLISSDSKIYSDVFDGEKYGEEIKADASDSKEVELIQLNDDKSIKMFGNNKHLVEQIRKNIETDVDTHIKKVEEVTELARMRTKMLEEEKKRMQEEAKNTSEVITQKQEDTEPTDKVILYENNDFKGNKLILEVGTSELNPNKKIGSIKVPNTFIVTINYKKNDTEFYTKNNSKLPDKEISTIIVNTINTEKNTEGYSYTKLGLIAAATAATAAGLYYAYKKYTKKNEKQDERKDHEDQSKNKIEKKSSEEKRSAERSAERSKKRSAERSKKRSAERSKKRSAERSKKRREKSSSKRRSKRRK
jgi:curved DNA-binding protein CbpA